jgi:hypothetical protein
VSNLHHVTLTGNSLRTHTGIRNAGRHIPRVHRTQRVTGPPRPNLLKGNGFSTTTATNTTTATMLPPHVRKYCPTTATPLLLLSCPTPKTFAHCHCIRSTEKSVGPSYTLLLSRLLLLQLPRRLLQGYWLLPLLTTTTTATSITTTTATTAKTLMRLLLLPPPKQYYCPYIHVRRILPF